MIHICTNCYKTFKTIQHLNQHKNRKFKCKHFIEKNLQLSSTQSKTLTESKNNSNTLENSVLNDNHSYLDDDYETSEINNSNNISSNSSIIMDDSPINSKIESSVDNLSLTNLLEIVSNHKKMLEEKNKLEKSLIILKNHLEYLTKENIDLKNKIAVVND